MATASTDLYADPTATHTAASNVKAQRRNEERGEGIISVALAVLIMAGLAALMWVAYNAMWEGANTKTRTKVESIAP
jgi:ferric-dicitrate binding protein FerR (iron transport regulator)